jgi:hypothetical protein
MFLALASGTAASAQAPRERVYVGEQACRPCHHQPGGRDQFSAWRLTKHAEAYAALSMAEALEIADLSGIEGDPTTNRICLGCHTTAYDTEEWERDETFHFADGIQCERCHGPGSAYIDDAVMRDPERARAAARDPSTTPPLCVRSRTRAAVGHPKRQRSVHRPRTPFPAPSSSEPWRAERAMTPGREVAHSALGGHHPTPTRMRPSAPGALRRSLAAWVYEAIRRRLISASPAMPLEPANRLGGACRPSTPHRASNVRAAMVRAPRICLKPSCSIR